MDDESKAVSLVQAALGATHDSSSTTHCCCAYSLTIQHSHLTVEFCRSILNVPLLCDTFNSALIEMDLSHNHLSDHGVELLCQSFFVGEETKTKNSTLKVLNLNGNHIGDIGACAVAETLTQKQNCLPALESLFLAHNVIRDLGAEALSLIVVEQQDATNLRELVCYDNAFGGRGRDYLKKAAASNSHCRLVWSQHLGEEEQASQSTSASTTSTSLETAPPPPPPFSSRTHIVTPTEYRPPPPKGSPRSSWRRSPVYLSREYSFGDVLNQLEQDLGVQESDPVLAQDNVEFSLQDAFLRLHYSDATLKCIDLEEIDQESAVSIASMIGMTHNSVTELCLTHSNLDHHFCSVLKNHHGLCILDLGSNQLGDGGILALIHAWSDASGLKFLNVSDNQIGDTGACALAERAIQSQALQSVCICENRIGDRGALALAHASAKLLYLFCWGNLFDYAGKDKLENANHNKLYWVRPYHWELELDAARDLALQNEAPDRSSQHDNLRKTKDVIPTSETYNEARDFVEKNFDPTMLLRRGTLTKVPKQPAEEEEEATPKPVVVARRVSSPRRQSLTKKPKPKKNYGESCRNWNKNKSARGDAPKTPPVDDRISLSALSFEGESPRGIRDDSSSRLINQKHNKKRREELQAILSSIEKANRGKTSFLKAASKIRELERRQELAHQYV